MSRLTRTLSAAALALLMGCQPNLSVETVTPLPDVRHLHIDTTIETAPLLERLMSGYRDSLVSVDIQSATYSHDVLMSRIMNGDVPYGLTLHPPEEKTLWSAPLAYDALVILVHPDNPILSLSPDDLRRLYSGVTRIWEMGGTVTVFSWPPGSGLRAEFERHVMGKRRLMTTAQLLPTSAAVQAQVAQDPNAIAYLPFSQWQPDAGERAIAINDVLPSLDTLNSGQYPLRLTVYLVGEAPPQGDIAAFLSWIQSRVGQDQLAPAYVPLLP
jgi:phosphate transport system substrate-binding protein